MTTIPGHMDSRTLNFDPLTCAVVQSEAIKNVREMLYVPGLLTLRVDWTDIHPRFDAPDGRGKLPSSVGEMADNRHKVNQCSIVLTGPGNPKVLVRDMSDEDGMPWPGREMLKIAKELHTGPLVLRLPSFWRFTLCGHVSSDFIGNSLLNKMGAVSYNEFDAVLKPIMYAQSEFSWLNVKGKVKDAVLSAIQETCVGNRITDDFTYQLNYIGCKATRLFKVRTTADAALRGRDNLPYCGYVATFTKTLSGDTSNAISAVIGYSFGQRHSQERSTPTSQDG